MPPSGGGTAPEPHQQFPVSTAVAKEVRRLVNESTFAPGGGQPGLVQDGTGLSGEDSADVRTFDARRPGPDYDDHNYPGQPATYEAGSRNGEVFDHAAFEAVEP